MISDFPFSVSFLVAKDDKLTFKSGLLHEKEVTVNES